MYTKVVWTDKEFLPSLLTNHVQHICVGLAQARPN